MRTELVVQGLQEARKLVFRRLTGVAREPHLFLSFLVEPERAVIAWLLGVNVVASISWKAGCGVGHVGYLVRGFFFGF